MLVLTQSNVKRKATAFFQERCVATDSTVNFTGAHVLEGSLVSSTYEQPNGKGKKSKTSAITSWSVRADVVRRLDRDEPEPNAPAPAQAPESNEAAV